MSRRNDRGTPNSDNERNNPRPKIKEVPIVEVLKQQKMNLRQFKSEVQHLEVFQ
jgi:hypothetical protein